MQAARQVFRAGRISPLVRQAPSNSLRCQHFSTRTAPLYAKKGAQDRDTLDPQSNEYSKTGSDGQAAQTSAAFDPKTTDPETQEKQAAKDAGSDADNSLNVSPANKETRDWDASAPKGSQGQDKSDAQRRRESQASGGGSPNKAGGGPSGSRPSGV